MKKHIVFAGFYNSTIDSQRGIYWEADASLLNPLIDSIKSGWHLVVFHDCLTEVKNSENVSFIKTEDNKHNVYFKKWFDTLAYLKKHPEVEVFFLVDSTDVVMCNDPLLGMIPDKIYSGDVVENLGSEWMRDNYSDPHMLPLLDLYNDSPLLCSGTWGAYRATGMSFLKLFNMIALHHIELNKEGYKANIDTDMGIYNYIAYTYFKGDILHGPFFNTIFKGYEDPLTTSAWWKHK